MKHVTRSASISLLIATAACFTGCSGGSDGGQPSPQPGPGVQPPPSSGGNSPPTISGQPSSQIVVGRNYLFTPVASDPDGDTLSFEVENLPDWASFDRVNGQLSGVPAQGDEGTYPDIGISASDGQSAASLPLFSITVNQIATGSVTLTWTPPTTNTDGSPLADLSSYKFYYGVSPGAYTSEIQVNNPGISRYVIDNLAPDTYYFVATTVNSDGVESVVSNEAVAVVQPGN